MQKEEDNDGKVQARARRRVESIDWLFARSLNAGAGEVSSIQKSGGESQHNGLYILL